MIAALFDWSDRSKSWTNLNAYSASVSRGVFIIFLCIIIYCSQDAHIFALCVVCQMLFCWVKNSITCHDYGEISNYWNGRCPSVHLSVWIVTDQYLCNHSLCCFQIGTANSHKWPSDLISILSCSSDVLPNARPWLLIISTTTCFDFRLELWTHLTQSNNWLAFQ